METLHAERRPTHRLVARVEKLDVRVAGAFLFTLIALMGLAGVVGRNSPLFELDGEVVFRWPLQHTVLSLPALWSGFLLVAAGLLWLAASREWRHQQTRWLPAALGLFLLFMSLDEVIAIHELLEKWFGIDWQLLYAGPVAIVGLGTLVLLNRLRRIDVQAAVLLLLGGGFWAASQVLEFLQWNGDQPAPYFFPMMIVEEVGEASGSALFLLAALSLLCALAATRGQPATRSS